MKKLDLIPLFAYPIVLGGALLSFWILKPIVPDAAPILGVITGMLMMAALEYLKPHAREWNRSHGDIRTDLALNVVGGLFPPLITDATIVLGLAAIAGRISASLGTTLWPSSWPLALQVLLALAAADFAGYWVHRALHAIPVLWRIHAVHHSAERIYWLNANRLHPLEGLMAYAPMIGVLVLLGCPPDVLAVWSVIGGTHGMLQHANIEMRLGILNWIFSTAELHRWHHSKKRAHADSNFAQLFCIWDILFGTRNLPREPHEVDDLGIIDGPDFRRSLRRMLIAPMLSDRADSSS